MCPNNPAYYLSNSQNTFFNHEGLTVVLTALAQVIPCNVYHLKLVIADNTDEQYDSGVFLEAKSLTSNLFQLTNLTQVDNTGQSYLVEGCATGSLKIRRQSSTLFSQVVNLGYGGTAINGIDVQTLPSSITIPANETEVLLNIFPIIDNVAEGNEMLAIYTLAACGIVTATDSTFIQIRDYDTLGISPDTAVICLNGSVQLISTPGYTTYNWNANPALNSTSISNPVATPIADSTMFICTAQLGTCFGKDSAFVYWKRLNLISTTNVNCRDGATGAIVVNAGPEWDPPIRYSIDNGPFQPSGTFSNLIVGTYTIRVKDLSSCTDSLVITITQQYPDLIITDTSFTDATCSGNPDGSVSVTVSGGRPPYQYSQNGVLFQAGNTFNVQPGSYNITVKDLNGCKIISPTINVRLNNSIILSTGIVPVICEGKNTPLVANTNATAVIWSPAASLNNASIINPIASPTVTTKYYIVATTGVCSRKDSLLLSVNPAPTAYAGKDSTICFGGSLQLMGSGGIDYSWEPAVYLSNPAIRDPLVVQPITVTYYLAVTDANGCISLKKDTVVITVSKPAKLDAGRDTAVAINQPLQLHAIDINNTGFISYSWSPARDLNNPFIKSPLARLKDAITFMIATARTQNNCIGIDTIIIKTYKGPEIYVANAFTPNGDGSNDVLKAFPVGIKSFSYFRIYNRYGQLIFSTTNENEGWDGKFKGAIQFLSSFVWIAEAIDYRGNLIQRKGTTTIIK